MIMKGFVALLVLCLWTAPIATGKKKNITKFNNMIRWWWGTSSTEHFVRSSVPTTVTTTKSPVACDRDYSCLDCTTARVCAPTEDEQSFYEVSRFTCPSGSLWCDPSSGTCTSVKPAGCVHPSNLVPGDFTCMRDGFYPDIQNCSRYFQCVGDLPYLLECPSSLPNYSPYTQECLKSDLYCANYEYDYYYYQEDVCDGYDGVKVLVRKMDNMFVYCVEDSAVVVDRCIGGYKFNVTSQNCEAACPHPGLFPSADDCAQYYRCSPRTNSPGETVLTMTLNLSCPEGQGFLEEAFECVDRSLVPNCKVSPQFFS